MHIYTYISHSIATSCRCSDVSSQQLYDAAMLIYLAASMYVRTGTHCLSGVHYVGTDFIIDMLISEYASYVSHTPN